MAVGVALLAMFVLIEGRFAKQPLMPLRIFSSRTLTAANVVVFLLGAAVFAMWFFLSLYLQQVRGYSPLRAGLAFLPMTLCIVICSTLASRVVTRIGPKPMLVFGMTVEAVGLLLFTGLSANGTYLGDVLVPSLLVAIGLGCSFVPVTIAAVAGVPPREAGLASGVVNTSRLFGGALGLAVLAALATSRTTHDLRHLGNSAQALHHALTNGFQFAFLISALIAAAGAAVARSGCRRFSCAGRVNLRRRSASPLAPTSANLYPRADSRSPRRITSAHMPRAAIVDIGTNSTRLLIAAIEDGKVTDELERRSNVTRLGAGVDSDGRLRDDAMQRVYDTLDEYRQLIDKHDADTAKAVLTSAVRDAANGQEFADTVKNRYGLEPHVLTGDQEASLTFLGATSERDPQDDTTVLVIDIGGGSTEFVIGTGRDAGFHVSNQAGVVRQTERHLHSDPPTDSEIDNLANDVRQIIEQGVPPEHREAVSHAIAVAGTATSLASIAQALVPYDPDKVQGYVLTDAERATLQGRLASVPLEQRKQTPGLDPARAPTIVAGAVILGEVMRLFGLEQVEVSEHDILRGAALGL